MGHLDAARAAYAECLGLLEQVAGLAPGNTKDQEWTRLLRQLLDVLGATAEPSLDADDTASVDTGGADHAR